MHSVRKSLDATPHFQDYPPAVGMLSKDAQERRSNTHRNPLARRPVTVLPSRAPNDRHQDANKASSDRYSVRELLPSAAFFPESSSPTVQAIQTDASAVKPGDLYIHLEECDAVGAQWAEERGASAIVAERLLPGLSTPLAIVSDIRVTHRLLNDHFSVVEDSSEEISTPLITIAGSIGRSTVVELLAAISLSEGKLIGLRNSDLEADGTGLDLPVGTSDQWLGRCNRNQADFALLAANPGSFPTKQTPSVACVTNLRCDGLETSGKRRWNSTAEHRLEVEKSLGNLTSSTTLALNADDADCVALASVHTGPIITFGELPHADVRAAAIESHTGGQVFIVTHGKQSGALSAQLPGAAFRSNCLAAIATAIAMGFDLPKAIRAVETALPRMGMLEPVVCGQPYALKLDRAMRPLAIRSAIEAARSSTTGKVLVALPLLENDNLAREQIVAAECLSDRLFVSCTRDIDTHLDDTTTLVEDRLQSLALAIGLADPGDVVLALGYRCDSDDRNLLDSLVRHRMTFEET